MTAAKSQSVEPSEGGPRIVVYTLDPCAPCEIVKAALKLLERDAHRLGWTIDVIATVLSDKKSVGAAFLAGVKQFPTVRLVRGRSVLKSFVSVREGWTAHDVASFLRSAIEAENETVDPPGNAASLAR